MQPSEIRPQRAQLTAAMLGLGLLGVVMAVFPFTCVLLALVVPLLACPLAGRKQQWAAWLAALAPATISLLAGFHPLYAVSLALPGLCAMATALWLKRSKRLPAPAAILYEMVAYAFALLCVVICAQAALGNAIAPGLAEWLVKRVQSSGNTGLLLYRFAAAGLIAVPEGYQKASLLSFAFDPVLIRQLLLSLRLTAERLIASALPSLFVQACMLGGLFTALRCQRLNCMVLLVEEGPVYNDDARGILRAHAAQNARHTPAGVSHAVFAAEKRLATGRHGVGLPRAAQRAIRPGPNAGTAFLCRVCLHVPGAGRGGDRMPAQRP